MRTFKLELYYTKLMLSFILDLL